MYELLTLPNGVRIVSEPMEAVRSASVGIWVAAGSRCEKREEGGSAHFIEHMLFKGTSSHSASELAQEMDAFGGQCNAFTGRNSTCFYARSPDTHLQKSIDILSEMFFDSLFAEEDVRQERGVILEEIGMYRDSPEDMVSEQLIAKCFPGSLGRSVLGTERTLAALTGQGLKAFKEREYRPDRVVISLAGSFTDAHIRSLAERFSQLGEQKKKQWKKAAYKRACVLKKKATEQNQLCLSWEGLPNEDERRYAWQLLSTVFGEGLSSRLFQTVREKYGLCYNIGSFTASFEETGLFGISTGVSRDTEKRALALIMDEVRKLLDEGVTQPELDRSRELIKANLLMAEESTASRMNRNGGSIMQLGFIRSVDEVNERYDAVTTEDLRELAQSLMVPEKLSFSAVGRIGEEAGYREILER